MESRGEGKIISCTKILTLDNKSATIEQGYQYPYQETDKEGFKSTMFKDIILKLDVKPHLSSDDRIFLSLSIEKMIFIS